MDTSEFDTVSFSLVSSKGSLNPMYIRSGRVPVGGGLNLSASCFCRLVRGEKEMKVRSDVGWRGQTETDK